MLFTSLRITYFSALSFYCTSTTDDERGLTKAIRKRHSADLLIDSECAQQESLYDWHTSSGHVVSLPSPILALLNATVRQRRVYKLHTTCSMEWKKCRRHSPWSDLYVSISQRRQSYNEFIVRIQFRRS